MTLKDILNQNDRFANSIGAQITELKPGYACTLLVVGEQHLNAGGVCQGGAIYTLADLAFAAVTNSHGILTLGISNTITFLHSALLGDTLTAECTERYDHHKLPYCDIKVTNQNGELIAMVTGLAYRTKKDFAYDELM